MPNTILNNPIQKARHTQSDGTVGKAILMLDIVESFRAPVKFNDILAQSPFPKPSTYRLLQTLVHQDLLSFSAKTGHYSLGTKLIRLAHSAWQNASLAPLAAPYLDALSALSQETIHLAKLDNGQVLYLDKRNATKPIPMFSDAGKIGPAYCTGVGKVMLAFLDEQQQKQLLAQQSFFEHTPKTLTSKAELLATLEKIRAERFAYDDEEHERNIICIAAPILTKNGAVLGAISITSSTAHRSLSELSQFKNALQDTAKTIAKTAEIWMIPAHGDRANAY